MRLGTHSVRLEQVTGDAVTAEPIIDLYNFSTSGTFNVEVFLDDDLQATTTIELAAENEHATTTPLFTLPKADLWSPDDLRLYNVRVLVADDDYCERVGFRSVKVTSTDILVNGNTVEITGANRHEDRPEWGNGLPLRLMKRDLDIFQNAGLNAVRTSHYPNHPLFLDFCDREGLLVFEEIPIFL